MTVNVGLESPRRVGQVVVIKPVRSLCGHQIEKYKIHHKKAIPIISMPYYNEKMKEGEFYAIETFATTGTGNVIERGQCNHYMVDYLNQKPKTLIKV